MQINKLAMALGLAMLGVAGSASALDPWVGSADYTNAPTTDGDEEVVGPFMSYNFGQGFVLVKPLVDSGAPGLSVGDTFSGFYQTYINDHIGIDGSGVQAPGLNRFGTGSGYELTFTTSFTEELVLIENLSGGRQRLTFEFTGGNSTLFFDTTPDYKFTTDSGFTDGNTLLAGGIVEGSSTVTLRSGAGTGFSDLTLEFSGAGSFSDQAVYDPDVAGALALFTLRATSSSTTGVSSVLGNAVQSGDQLLTATGDLQLLAAPVPVPAAIYLLGSAVFGIGAVGRRKQA